MSKASRGEVVHEGPFQFVCVGGGALCLGEHHAMMANAQDGQMPVCWTELSRGLLVLPRGAQKAPWQRSTDVSYASAALTVGYCTVQIIIVCWGAFACLGVCGPQLVCFWLCMCCCGMLRTQSKALLGQRPQTSRDKAG
jgi:hypothetical protein